MASLKKNIAANFAGSVWTGIVSLVFIPLYLRFMGVEGYGLVGFFMTLQAVLALLDAGLATTLNREFAWLSSSDDSAPAMRRLLRTFETIYWSVALGAGLLVMLLARWMASEWFHPNKLSIDDVRQTIVLMGFVFIAQWPDRNYAARLRVPPFTGAVYERETAPLLEQTARTGDTYAELPMVYHNLVRRSLLERIRAKAGHYFDGLAPDVYSAYAIGSLIERFVVVDYPLTIVGASASSNTNRVAVGKGHLHAAEYTDFRFSWMTPESWILPASIPDNVVRALTDVGRTDLLVHLDVPRIFARTIHAEPRRAREHLRKYVEVRRAQRRGVASGVALIGLGIMAKLFLGAARKLRRTPEPDGVWFENVQSLGAAIATQNQWLTDHGIEPPI